MYFERKKRFVLDVFIVIAAKSKERFVKGEGGEKNKKKKKKSLRVTPLCCLMLIFGAHFVHQERKCSLCCNDALYNVHLQRLQLSECDFMTDKSSSDDAE